MSHLMNLIVLRSDSSCPGDTQVAVVISRTLLCQQSPVFKTLLSDKWNSQNSGTEDTTECLNTENGEASTDDNPNASSEKEEQKLETAEKDTAPSGQHIEKEPEKVPQDDLAFVVNVKCFKALSVKILFDYLQGHKAMLDQCEDFEVLADIISLCDFYDMTKYVNIIEAKIERTHVTMDNMMNAMQAVDRYESMDVFKSSAEKLKLRCGDVFANNINGSKQATKDVMSFVQNNTSDSSLLARLFKHADKKIKTVVVAPPVPACSCASKMITSYSQMLNQCTKFDVLGDMISTCSDATQFVRRVEQKIQQTNITMDNVMEAMRSVNKYESHPELKHIAKSLVDRCASYFASEITSIKSNETQVGKMKQMARFVRDNSLFNSSLARLFREVEPKLQQFRSSYY